MNQELQARRRRGAARLAAAMADRAGPHASMPWSASLESSEFLRQSQTIADTWRARGAITRYEVIAGMNHFTIVDALSDPDSAMVARLAALCQSTQTRLMEHDPEKWEPVFGQDNAQIKCQKNAWMPVCARPRMSAWISCVPS